ncbi:MAG: glycosyltransferase [Selenomonadaceae bacterium]|nr:glycosyltransferase [Selenomonadaceae bacterium]
MPINNAHRSTCAVSVIIPLYNAEKYLSVCLESILNQTFTDFELLVVDDCSTDSSYAIAESYLEKFGGRLKIISLPENTGSGVVPRNVGFDLSCGKYVCFVDNDDILVDNALETLYNFAEKYQTDVVYMDYYFAYDFSEVSVMRWGNSNLQEPTLETNDIAERVEKFCDQTFSWMPWTKFVRRDFLIDNKIKFPRMKISDDLLWTFEIFCLAKNFLRIPTPLYIYRTNDASILHRERTPEEKIIFWTSPLLSGFELLETFMNRIDFFVKNPRIRLRVLHFFCTLHFNLMEEPFKELSSPEVWETFLHEFSKAGSTHPVLISYLLFISNIYRNELKK